MEEAFYHFLYKRQIRIEQNYKHPIALMPSSPPHRAIQITCEAQDVRAALGPYTQAGNSCANCHVGLSSVLANALVPWLGIGIPTFSQS